MNVTLPRRTFLRPSHLARSIESTCLARRSTACFSVDPHRIEALTSPVASRGINHGPMRIVALVRQPCATDSLHGKGPALLGHQTHLAEGSSIGGTYSLCVSQALEARS